MSNTTNSEDSDELSVGPLSGFGAFPSPDPPRDWDEITRDAREEAGLRGALSGLPKDSPAFTLFSERLAEFLGVSIAELELGNE